MQAAIIKWQEGGLQGRTTKQQERTGGCMRRQLSGERWGLGANNQAWRGRGVKWAREKDSTIWVEEIVVRLRSLWKGKEPDVLLERES